MDQPLEQEWRNFELYEKIRVRDRRRRFWVITLAVVLFFGLCSVPVVRERMPKWQSLDAALELSLEIERMKTRSIQEKRPVVLRFTGSGAYRMEFVLNCESKAEPVLDKEGHWPDRDGMLKILGREELERHSIALGVEEFCFDPVYGLSGVKSRLVLVVAPVKDLAEGRLERASYVELEGESAKISIN
ncbi:MAG: hypothetical protein KGP28_04275 [Bdellovibrionales bacterium]|nr:hypothetical protein [Bdellovibrionales bacterium]